MTRPSTPSPELIARWQDLARKASGGREPAELARRLGQVQLPALAWERPGVPLPSGRAGPYQARVPVRSITPDLVEALYERFVSPLVLAEPDLLIGSGSPGDLGELLPSSALGYPVAFQAGASAGPVLDAALELARERQIPEREVYLTVQGDPLGALARLGGLAVPAEQALSDLAAPVERALGLGQVTVLAPSGVWAAEAGAEPATQIAVVLCSFIAMLKALEGRGISPSQAAEVTELAVALRGDVIVDLASVRALRHLAARVLAASGAPRAPVRLYASVPTTELASVDTTTNLLRLSSAGFAGVAAGADALGLPAHDAATAAPSAKALLLSANLHLLLSREARVDRVQDPTAGSYAIESLTSAIAERAWAEVRRIEGEGGLLASLRTGAIQERIAQERAARAARIARRSEAWVGVSQFVDASADLPAPAPELPASSPAAELVTPALPWRPAAGWESLQRRLRPRQVSVMLIELGPLKRHKARSDFARDLFAAAGFLVNATGPVIDPDAGAVAFATGGAPFACICGSDDDYERLAPTLATQLKAAGARAVLLAGRLPAEPEPWRQAGIDHAVHLGADLLATLTALADALELA